MIEQNNLHVKPRFPYIAVTAIFLILTSSNAVSPFRENPEAAGFGLLIVPLIWTVFLMAAVVINNRVITPRFLVAGRYRLYAALLFLVSYTTLLSASLFGSLASEWFGCPIAIPDLNSPSRTLAIVFCDSVLLLSLLFGFSLFYLYRNWNEEVKRQETLTATLDEYINSIHKRLNPSEILGRLDSLNKYLKVDASSLESGINDFASYLRHQLYELPEPPRVEDIPVPDSANSKLRDLLAAPKRSIWRNLLLSLLLLCYSVSSFIPSIGYAPTSVILTGIILLFLILMAPVYFNILILYRRFRSRQNIRRYMAGVGVEFAVVAVPMVVMEISSYVSSPVHGPIPAMVSILSISGSILIILSLLGGVTALLLFQNWILTRLHTSALRAETIRHEYAYLKEQINPHFLFNVLNGISIIAYDSPEIAERMLNNLSDLLRYQVEDLGKESTIFKKELNFLHSYLALEKMRHPNFEYSIDIFGVDPDLEIPNLLFIPFVENAAKYAAGDKPGVHVCIRFTAGEGHIDFECVNLYCETSRRPSPSGGIGIKNTIRRLDLLFGDRYLFDICRDDSRFRIHLLIPML